MFEMKSKKQNSITHYNKKISRRKRTWVWYHICHSRKL